MAMVEPSTDVMDVLAENNGPEKMTAYYNGNLVEISGGYQDPERGHCVEISSQYVKRHSLSIWKLYFPNDGLADNVFHNIFNTTLARAKAKDEAKAKAKAKAEAKKAKAEAEEVQN